jgi:HAD superfamily hydrolase (TIGR01662 family)
VIRAAAFDIGETLVDETRVWAGWADALGVPHLTFFGVLGAVIERGEHHRRAFEIVAPGVDVRAMHDARVAAGEILDYVASDLYPDALPCLRALQADGIRIALVGNQPASVEPFLQALGVDVDLIASSERWGVEKPSPAFFERLVSELGLPPSEIAYVGDRLDNDVLPAVGLGMRAILLRRGPWGYLHARTPEAARASAVLEGLDRLPAVLRDLK